MFIEVCAGNTEKRLILPAVIRERDLGDHSQHQGPSICPVFNSPFFLAGQSDFVQYPPFPLTPQK